MITALYSRVSTSEQAENGYSIGDQKEKLEAYVKAKDLGEFKHYSDGGYSGSSLNRPAIQQLITDIKSGRVSEVLIWKLDRLSRSQKDTLKLVQELFNVHNVKFLSLNENLDTSTPMGMAMIGIMSAFAELERSQITERMHVGRVARAKAGLYHGGGNHNPLGYDYLDGMLVINEYQAKAVRDVYKFYLAGNSMNETTDKIMAKYPNVIKSRTSVRNVLESPLYIGKVTFEGKTYDGMHEPIIDKETFYKANELRKSRKEHRKGTNKRKGLLVGKIWCGHCGARYGREVRHGNRPDVYKCYSRFRNKSAKSLIRDRNCKGKHWKESELDEEVIRIIKNLDFANFEQKEKLEKESTEFYEKELEKINIKENRLLDLYVDGRVNVEKLDERLKEIEETRQQLINQIEKIKHTPKTSEAINTLNEFDWDNEPKTSQISIIDEMIDRIVINDDDVSIYFNFM